MIIKQGPTSAKTELQRPMAHGHWLWPLCSHWWSQIHSTIRQQFLKIQVCISSQKPQHLFLKAVKRFFKDVKVKPKLIRTDFDRKLIAGEVSKYIEEEQHVDLEASPPYRQHQNGLVERTWQTAVTMCRNWITSSLLPSKYWWFGIKHAIEIMNILPSSHKGKCVKTPHELVFGTKVDYDVLFPMFSVAYLKQERE